MTNAVTDMEKKEKLNIEEVLLKEGKYVGPTSGVSMLPMLKTGRDSVVIRPPAGRLKRLDVALYKRGGDYVLHRVIEVKDGGYVIRGDNCYGDEAVREGDVRGVLTEFFRKDKHVFCTDKKYLRYAKRRVKLYPARRFFARVKGRLKNVVKACRGRGKKKRDGAEK